MESAPGTIILTGFMGTGKSTVGRLVADRLGLPFVDTDAEIERRHGPIPRIFAGAGEAHFRALERELVGELASSDEPRVIATGGGTAIDPVNADLLEAMGAVFLLTAHPDEIVRRAAADGLGERPLLADAEPAERVTDLLDERAEAYSRFVPISTDGRSAESVAQAVIDAIEAPD